MCSYSTSLFYLNKSSKPNTKLYKLGTDITYKMRITASINNIKQGRHAKCFNKHSILRSLSLVLKMDWLDQKRVVTVTI